MKPELSRVLILGFAPAAALFFLVVIAFHPLLALGVLFVSHMLLLFPTLVANCQWWGPVLTHFETSRREVWLTIDDGPDPIQTPRLLEILRRFEAKATFFVIGERAAKFPAALEAIGIPATRLPITLRPIRARHSGVCRRGASQRRSIAAPSPRAIFAPAGMKNFFVHPALARRKMALVGWTVRGLDTSSQDADAVAVRILGKIRPGAIILLHEGHRTATDPDFHPRCLERTLTALTNANYRCVLPQSL